jgi:hypothetical protein
MGALGMQDDGLCKRGFAVILNAVKNVHVMLCSFIESICTVSHVDTVRKCSFEMLDCLSRKFEEMQSGHRAGLVKRMRQFRGKGKW